MLKVLVGITTKNRATILPKAIHSALNQDYLYKEIAVLDDASTDQTDKLRSRYPQVHWCRSESTLGIAEARNRLMRNTGADFYFSLDDDAWFVVGDEISSGVRVLEERPNVAALAYDILTPDLSNTRQRSEPYVTHSFIGCGHMLRLAAVREINYYAPNPGSYGSEEKDLSIRLLNRGHEILHLPGVHVWHEKTMLARDLSAQHVSGVCNDLVFAYRRCPLPMALWLIPGKAFNHLRFSAANQLLKPFLKGLLLFIQSLPKLAGTRAPVSESSFRKYLKLSRASS